jgi:hypothetical protein
MNTANSSREGLRGGILVIGSLLWENEQNALDKAQGILRSQWRSKWLDVGKAISIKCPIRYGRVSQSRKNTCTMLFSNSTPAKGNAILVPFKEAALVDEQFSGITEQLLDLARAEGISKEGEVFLFKNWGTIALCITPQLKQTRPETAKKLEDWWVPQFKGMLKPQTYRVNGTEQSSVTAEAFINFPIEPDNPELDYFFCTPVILERTDYPSSEEIAQRIKKSGYDIYFLENRKHGITTFQDNEILQVLQINRALLRSQKIAFEDYYNSSNGVIQFRKDLMRNLGEQLFAEPKLELCRHILRALSYSLGMTSGTEDELREACKNIIDLFKAYFGDFSEMLLKPIQDVLDQFLFHLLDFEKVPGQEKNRIEKLVKQDMKRTHERIKYYEDQKTIREIIWDRISPRNHEERTLFDFYLRNQKEFKKITDYFLNGIEQRALVKSKTNYSFQRDYFEDYHDRPYLSSIALPVFEEYFDHRKIDLAGHKIASVPITEGRKLKKIYQDNKQEFYHQLQMYRPVDTVFHEINHYVAMLPKAEIDRKDLFTELIELFKQEKWFGFYGLALTQIEGLFSEMVAGIKPTLRLPSLTDKVEAARPYYEFSHNNFDYFQYYIPLLRNKFMHSGIDSDVKLKCFDLLYDLSYLLSVFEEFKTPYAQVNRILKKKDPLQFINYEDFNVYFDLLDGIRGSGHYEKIKTEVELFESEFLSTDVSIHYLVLEVENHLATAFDHWYNTILMFTDLNSVKKDVKMTPLNLIERNKEEYVLALKPCYHAYEDIFATLLSYQVFLQRSKVYLPNLSNDTKAKVDELLNHYKDDFKKLSAIMRIIRESEP